MDIPAVTLEQLSTFRKAPATQSRGNDLPAGRSVIPGELSRFALLDGSDGQRFANPEKHKAAIKGTVEAEDGLRLKAVAPNFFDPA